LTVTTFTTAAAALFIWAATALLGTIDRQQHAGAVYADARTVLIDLLNAETGQRGYVVTGDEAYLEPYERGSAAVQEDLKRLAAHADPQAATLVAEVQDLAGRKLDEMDETILLRQNEGLAPATRAVADNRGKQWMDQTRNLLADIIDREQARQQANTAALIQSLAALRTIVFFILGFSFSRSVLRFTRRMRPAPPAHPAEQDRQPGSS
jgi:CHASE3 domain sensor protein